MGSGPAVTIMSVTDGTSAYFSGSDAGSHFSTYATGSISFIFTCCIASRGMLGLTSTTTGNGMLGVRPRRFNCRARST